MFGSGAVRVTYLVDCIDDVRGTRGRLISIDQLLRDPNLTSFADPLHIRTHGLHHAFAALWICVADIDLQRHFAGYAVDRSREHVAGTYCGHGVDSTGGECMPFD